MSLRNTAQKLLCLLLCLCLPLSCAGCSAGSAEEEKDTLHVVAATYPVYALACAVSAGSEGMEISRLNTGQVSCLHDYTLTVSDMRRLEQADLLLLNGAGLEDFLTDALTQTDALQVDCSAAIDLLCAEAHEHTHTDGDGHGEELDPHYWMDPRNAAQMALAIAQGLSEADPDRAAQYAENAALVSEALTAAHARWLELLSGLSHPYLITFHDGFRYFAAAYGLELLFSMEEEDGATASAKDILAASSYVKQYSLPAIFMETNGSGAAARAVSGETGAAIGTLSMLMDGPDAEKSGDPLAVLTALYLTPMEQNILAVKEALQ